MDYLAKIVSRIGRGGVVLGTVFLIGTMSLIVGNVFYRFFGHVIGGTYELSELMAVVCIVFALGYAALEKRHVVIQVVVSRLPQRAQAILEAVMSFISMGVWILITWASVLILSERWIGEKTEMLMVPYLPFRFAWLFGLSLLCLVYLVDLVRALSQAVRK